MINDLTAEKELDHRLNFDQLPSFTALVDETFQDNPEASGEDEVFREDGRLNVPLLLRNAKILLAAEDYTLAKSIFQTLIEHGEGLGAAYAGLGVCYENDSKLDLAIKAYREAIIYEPSYTSLIALSDLFIRKLDHRAAIATLLRANHLPKIRKKESFEIHKNLGNCYLRINQLDHAEKHYREALALVPASDTLHTNIGCLFFRRGDLASALLHFNQAIVLNATNSRAMTGVGLVHLEKGDKNLALDHFEQAMQCNLGNTQALFQLIACAFATKRFDQPITIVSNYVAHHSYNINVLYSLAGMMYHKKDLVGVQRECRRILELKPDHQGAQKLLEMVAIA